MEVRYQQFFEQVPGKLRVQGPNLVITHANKDFRAAFGEAVGRPCYDVVKQRVEQCLVCPAQQTFGDGVRREHEDEVVLTSGETINVRCSSAPIRDTDGQIVSVIVMFNDITKMRQLQSQLTSIGLLVGSISHGIKGLLTGLDGGIYLMNTGLDHNKPERVKQGWEMVQRNIGRIRSMVLDILYYAKDRDLEIADIQAVELAKEIGEIMAKKATSLGVTLDIDIASDSGSFHGDAKAIRAALLNILENSLEACHSDREKSSHWVRFAARREPPWMRFEVQDDGIGMDRETRDKVFSLFFSSKGIKGTGLGLFISNKIVDKHGGSIEVESKPGQGASFQVRIPLQGRPSTRLLAEPGR